MMNIKNIIVNTHPKNILPLPVYLHTASEYYQQGPLNRPRGSTFYQILAVLNGEGVLRYNNETYKLKKGSGFFVAPYTPVSYNGSKDFVTAFLTVKGDSLPMICDYFKCGSFLFKDNIDTYKFRTDISKITSEYYSNKRDSIISSLCYSCFMSFFENEDNNLIKKIALYLEKNFSKKLTLQSISKAYNISVSKLCHDFKKEFNCSVFEYILNLRLSYARSYISLNPGIKTKQLAAICGFQDASYFCKAYKKKYSTTPSKML